MKIIKIIAATIGLTALTLACVAQEEEDEGPIAFTYATYYYCTGGPQSRADEIMAEDADRMNGFVEDGTITGWGWLKHHTGGQWSRAQYFQAETMEALLNAYDVMGDDDGDDDAADEDDGPGFAEICPSHDDYIWQVDSGSNSETRGAAGFSVYYVCDVAKEARASEIVDEHMAPILNGFVEDGTLSSWGYSTHVVGGRFRSLQTMTAPDMQSLMAGRGKVIEAVYAEGSEAGEEFSEICGPHVDYLWNIGIEK
jgi:hypothetical protein